MIDSKASDALQKLIEVTTELGDLGYKVRCKAVKKVRMGFLRRRVHKIKIKIKQGWWDKVMKKPEVQEIES